MIKKPCLWLKDTIMFAIILFCLLNSAASLSITSPSSDLDVNSGKNVQVKWEFTTDSGETFISGNIKLVPPGKPEVNIAIFQSESNIVLYPEYSRRKWSVTLNQNTKKVDLNIVDARKEDDGVYSLELSYIASLPTTKKLGIRLNVLVIPYYPAGSFDSGTKTFDEGKTVTIKCEPEGSPKPIEIIWEKNNVRIRKTNTDNSNLVFSNVTRDDKGTYVCKASNKAGSALTNPSTQLIVKYKPVNTKFNVSKGQVLLLDTAVDLECTADADPVATFNMNGAGIADVSSSSTGKQRVTIRMAHDGKTRTCTPSNRLGHGPTVGLVIDVKVPAKVTFLPTKLDAIEGRNISVTCRASGKPAPAIVWLKNGSPLRKMPQYFIYSVPSRNLEKLFKSTSTLTLAPARREDNGRYGCQAINPYGNQDKSVELNLLYLPEVKNINDFKEREVRVGTNVDLPCRAEGNPPTTYYVWRWENGSLIQNKTTGLLRFDNIQPHEGGRLSCSGGSYVGEGKKVFVNVLVRVPPRIIIPPQQRVSLNESDRLQLFCNATGVPKPTIHWTRDGSILHYKGDHLSISDVKYTHRGVYVCTADNGIPPNASESSIVTIYFRPVIQTTSAAATLLGADSGELVTLVCIADALPVAMFKWRSYPSMQELNNTLPDILSINQEDERTSTMQVRARFGAKYECYTYNNRGTDTQIYEIRPKGPPEAPYLTSIHTYIKNVQDQLSTVHVYLKWRPGYNGGQKVWYNIFYGPRADQAQNIPNVDDECNCYTITQNLEANTDYIFYVQAQNSDGPSNGSNPIQGRTKAFYGSASVERLHDGKIVKVSFVIYTKENLTKEVRFRENKERSPWDTRTTDPDLQVPLVIEDLDPEKHYLFQVLWYAEGKIQITDGGEVGPWKPPVNSERSSSTLSKEEIIAIIAGVGGFILIVILVLFLCLIRRRQKPKRDETVVVMRRQPQSVDVVTRRSLLGSVEDDPFESAHYGTQEKKKKARDSYYLPDSEDMNTFTGDDNTGKRMHPAESSQAYQPFNIDQKSKYNMEERLSSDDDSYRYKSRKQQPSDDELSSEPGYARVGDNGKVSRDNTDGPRDPVRPNQNDTYAKVNKRNNNNRPTSNGRGAPPPYRPRSTTDTPLPPYPDDHLDLDDPSAVPFDDPLPPPMPVFNSRSIPDPVWNDRYSDDPLDSIDTTLERHKSPSRTSLGSGKPYINAQGKLVRPSSRHSSSDHLSDSEQRLPEPEVPTGRSRQRDVDNDESNLVSYLV